MTLFGNLSPLAATFAWLATLALALALLYLIRSPAHRLIRQLALLLHAFLRQVGQVLQGAGQTLWANSYLLLVALARQQLSRGVQRHFSRVGQFVESGLGSYPHLERQIASQIARLDEDYQRSGLVPPPDPEWVTAVDSVVKLKLTPRQQPLMEKVLDDIRAMAEEQQRETLRHYRQTVSERHSLLKRLLPGWRRLAALTEKLGLRLHELSQRSHQIDRQMARLEQMEAAAGTPSRFTLSFLTYFLVSGAALVILTCAAWVNVSLLAAPLEAAFSGATSGGEPVLISLGGFAAGLWLGLQLLLGLVILEMLQVTQILPALGQITPSVRRVGVTLCALILVALAALAAVLVWQSGLWGLVDNLSALERHQAYLALLLSTSLAFILPLILLLAGIPLEVFLDSLRPIIGFTLGALLRVTGGLLRLLGQFFRRAGPVLVVIYDVIIFLPLLLERQWQRRRNAESPATDALSET